MSFQLFRCQLDSLLNPSSKKKSYNKARTVIASVSLFKALSRKHEGLKDIRVGVRVFCWFGSFFPLFKYAICVPRMKEI